MGDYYPQTKEKCTMCGGSGILLITTSKGWMECRYCKGIGKRSEISRNLQRAGWVVSKELKDGN